MNNLQKNRLKQGLSQSQLAKISGVPLRTIQNYEGSYRCIDGAKLSALVALSNSLDCKIYDILQDEELAEELKKCI